MNAEPCYIVIDVSKGTLYLFASAGRVALQVPNYHDGISWALYSPGSWFFLTALVGFGGPPAVWSIRTPRHWREHVSWWPL